MAKKNKSGDAYECFSTTQYSEFYNSLPQNDKDMIKELGISDSESLIEFFSSMGVDVGHGLLNILEHSDEKNLSQQPRTSITKKCVKMKQLKASEYHLRVKLMDAPVPVWREFKVPSSISLDFFADIVNIVMGWDGVHLHKFMKGNTHYLCDEEVKEFNMNFCVGRFEEVLARDYNLSDILEKKGDRIKYEYDFGDGWIHEIWVKGIREYEKDEKHKVELLKGKGTCPPEDCGGIWGYASLLEMNRKKSKTKYEKDRLRYYGINNDFDPEYFDIDSYIEVVNEIGDIS